ncbi:MAG TPA: mycofactocin biosynthesis peptidyl-dipeptidase MftE [Acidimicrobiales bacterium]|nr:mycofactocin biosynthesis peptidyl-dipeptidase MftE [Acidimicrobiales bacterium]
MRLGARTWLEVHAAGPRLLAVPLGSCEQHGPHLPLDTDTRVAVQLADRLAAARDDVVVAPALAYGASGEHAGFAGTLSIGQDGLTLVVVELVRSADAFAGVVLVNGHGGNATAIDHAVTILTAEGRRVLPWSPSVEGDAHAGRTETAVLLALAPSVVRMERAEAGATAPLAELMPALRAGGVASVAANGVLGDPTGASADEGRRMLDAMSVALIAAVADWRAAW